MMLIHRHFFMLYHLSLATLKANMTLISAVEALGEIAEQLGKKGWNFNLKHCDKNLNWQTPIVDSSLMYDCTVNCTCLSDDECHISAMYVPFYVFKYTYYSTQFFA